MFNKSTLCIKKLFLKSTRDDCPFKLKILKYTNNKEFFDRIRKLIDFGSNQKN